MPRYSKSFLRDIAFYWHNRRYTFFGNKLPIIDYDRCGVDGMHCFWLIDSRGKYVATRHPRLVRALLATKKSINWHLRVWSEGFLDMCEPLSYYKALFIDPPDWVGVSFHKLVIKNVKGWC